MVLQSSRCSNDDVRLLGERNSLRHGVHPSYDYGHSNSNARAERRELLCNLVCQLPVPMRLHQPPLSPLARKIETHLVGARTQANSPLGSSHSAWRMGSANAAVFPLPVSASPIMSLPASAKGIHSFWIELGEVYPRLSHAETSGAMSPSEAKDTGFSGSSGDSVVSLVGRDEEVEAAGGGEGERPSEPALEPASEPEPEPL